jgi:hypothetical protein
LLLSAVINGFGSVSFPFNSLAPFYLQPVSKEALAHAESELDRLIATLEDLRYKLISLSATSLAVPSGSAPSSNGATTATTGRRRNSSFSDLGEDLVHRRSSLASEIAFVESLVADTKDDLAEMRHARTLSLRARTPAGRLLSWLGAIMSIVLLLRLLTVTIGLNRWSSTSRGRFDEIANESETRPFPRADIVTSLLLWTMGHTSLVTSQQQLDQLSQFISLVLSSFLSVSQIRTFLRTVSAVHRRLSSLYSTACSCPGTPPHRGDRSSGGVETISVMPVAGSCVLATLGGCYLLACVVLTKLMLPPQYRRSFAEALLVGGGGGGAAAAAPYDDGRHGSGAGAAIGIDLILWVRSYALDAAFVATAVLSASVLAALFGIQRSNTRRFSSWGTTTAATAPPAAAAASGDSGRGWGVPQAASSSGVP